MTCMIWAARLYAISRRPARHWTRRCRFSGFSGDCPVLSAVDRLSLLACGPTPGRTRASDTTLQCNGNRLSKTAISRATPLLAQPRQSPLHRNILWRSVRTRHRRRLGCGAAPEHPLDVEFGRSAHIFHRPVTSLLGCSFSPRRAGRLALGVARADCLRPRGTAHRQTVQPAGNGNTDWDWLWGFPPPISRRLVGGPRYRVYAGRAELGAVRPKRPVLFPNT